MKCRRRRRQTGEVPMNAVCKRSCRSGPRAVVRAGGFRRRSAAPSGDRTGRRGNARTPGRPGAGRAGPRRRRDRHARRTGRFFAGADGRSATTPSTVGVGRIRRLAESDGGASFTVETIRKVGYRLALTEAVCAAGTGPRRLRAARLDGRPPGLDRRGPQYESGGSALAGRASLLQGAPATASLAPARRHARFVGEADSGPITLGDARFVFTPEAPRRARPRRAAASLRRGGAWLDGQGQPRRRAARSISP